MTFSEYLRLVRLCCCRLPKRSLESRKLCREIPAGSTLRELKHQNRAFGFHSQSWHCCRVELRRRVLLQMFAYVLKFFGKFCPSLHRRGRIFEYKVLNGSSCKSSMTLVVANGLDDRLAASTKAHTTMEFRGRQCGRSSCYTAHHFAQSYFLLNSATTSSASFVPIARRVFSAVFV